MSEPRNLAWFLKGNCTCCAAAPIGTETYKPEYTLALGDYKLPMCKHHFEELYVKVGRELALRQKEERVYYQSACPVCGTENQRTVYTEAGIGVVEEHYFCPCCGYSEEMAYSPSFVFFEKRGTWKERRSRRRVRLKNWKKAWRCVYLQDHYRPDLGQKG